MPKSTPRNPHGEIGALLRQWREARNQSQLALSLSAGISQRHLSFVEIGRSIPSREVIVGLAEVLDIPFRDRNALLLAAGYAPLYEESGWDDAQLQHVTQALRRVLHQHEPYPAMVIDRYWNVVLSNDAAPAFFGRFVDLSSRPKPRNLLHLIFDPAALRPYIANWDEIAGTLIHRIYREAVGRVLDDRLHALLDALLSYPGTRPEWRTPGATPSSADLPVIPIRFDWRGAIVSYFSMLTTLATPQTVATQELRIECMFPLDAFTETQHARIMQPVRGEQST